MIKKGLPLIFVLLVVLFSCGKKKTDFAIPDDVIKRGEMVKILADVHIAEATINLRNVAVPDVRNLNAALYKNIFVKHQITKEEFTKSYNFYSNNTELFNEMYDSVIMELNKMQAEVEKK
jgi:Domain of unknown function (DUF4296)